MKSIILSVIISLLLSGCFTTIPIDQFKLNIKSSPDSNNGNNYLLVYEQPTTMDKMSRTTHSSLSREILDSNHQSRLIHPQYKNSVATFKAKNEPASIYFVMNIGKKHNTWRYYIPNPAGKSWDCLINKDSDTNCKESG